METVALRAGAADTWDVYYCWKKPGTIDPEKAIKTRGSQNRLEEDEKV